MASESKETGVHLDEILKKFRLFHWYQIKTILVIGFAFFFNGMHCINYIFVAESIPYRCNIEQCESGSYEAPWYNITAPDQYRQCYKYGGTNETGCAPTSFDPNITEPCESWIYMDDASFASEFQLACQDWKLGFVGTVHSVGLMIGLFFQGQLSDKIGRKAAIIIAGLAAAVFGVAKSFARTYSVFIVLELLEATLGDSCSPAFIMGVELVQSERRLDLQIFFSILFGIGGLFMCAVAYYLAYWRYFVQAIYAPSIIFLVYFFIMDESVRWLLSKGKKNKAINILLKTAKKNGVQLDAKVLSNIQCEEKDAQSSPLRDTFCSKIVVKRFLVCLVWWISCTFISYGLIVNAVSLAGDKYINFGLIFMTDIPASFAMVYTLKKFNRKKPLFFSFLGAGLLYFVQPFIPKKYVWLSTGLYLIGKFVATFTFGTVYMYTSELFPTYTRNSMHALCSAIGRLGSILAPMTPLLAQYLDSLPTLLIGAISIIAGLTTLLIPDLIDEPLPDNVQQAEHIGTNLQMKIKGKSKL